MDKLREHFEHELSTSNIPYKELADENTLNVWFKQFCNAPKIPSLWLYILQYLNEEEYVDAIENNRTLLQKMQNEFYDHQIKKTLDKRYYISKIKETTISKALFDIAKTRELFFDSANDNSTDRYQELKDTVNFIIGNLEEIPRSFASAIIENIRKEDIDIHIFIMREFGGEELSKHNEIKLKRLNTSFIQQLKNWEKQKNNETPKEKGNKKQNTESSNTRTKFIANEYALAYIFDLLVNDKQVPTNRTEGGLAMKEIKKIGKLKEFEKPDTFYRAVKKVLEYDLNSPKELQNISKDWRHALESLSEDWGKVKSYLLEKNIIAE